METIRQVKFESKSEWDAEKAAYETSLRQMQDRIQDMEAHLRSKISENDDQKNMNASLIKELSLVKSQTKPSEISNLRSELSAVTSILNDEKDRRNSLEQQIIRTEAKVNSLQAEANQLKDELERANQKLEIVRNERTEAYEQLKALRESTAQQELNVSGVEQEKITLLQKEIEELTNSRDRYKEQAERDSL